MRYFTDEEIKQLEQYNIVKHFNTAIYAQYVIGITSVEIDILNKVWLQANSNTPNSLYNWNCNTCALKNFKLIGKHYFTSKQQLQLTQPTVEPTTKEETKEPTKEVQLIKQPTKITNTPNKLNTDGNKKKGRPSRKESNTK